MHPYLLHTCQQAREIDRLIVDELGISGFQLMTRAGEAGYRIMMDHWPTCKRIVVFCGRGNNGGDGYILAAESIKRGLSARVYRLGEPNTPEARKACAGFLQMDGVVEDIGDNIDLDDYDLAVDALLGSGLTRNVDGTVRHAIERIDLSGMPVLALDIPSGLDGDTGAVRGTALRAEVTATFITTKVGLVSGEGRYYRGHLELDSLDISALSYQRIKAAATYISMGTLAAARLRRRMDAHKGDVGRVLVIGGNRTMQGAALMAGRAALRAGAGLVSIASVSGCAELICSGAPEIRGFPIENGGDLAPLLDNSDVVGIGPGLGQDAWAVGMWNEVLQRGRRLVVDADALNLLAQRPQKRTDWLLTPHPGEAGRLLGISAGQVQADRMGAANQIAEMYGGICVLKGAGTVVAGGERTWLCDLGNPGMATGGMGDILTGILGALWGQGLTAEQAACMGVWLHAKSGDDIADEAGQIGMVATDLLLKVRANLSRVMEFAEE